MTITGTISSVIATAVIRWRQSLWYLNARRRGCGRGRAAYASKEEPCALIVRLRSHRRRSIPARCRDAADQCAPGQRLALVRLETVAEFPDEMADTAEQVMHQRPSVAEHDQVTDEAAGERPAHGIGTRARSRRDRHRGDSSVPKIERHAGGAVDDGQRHGQRPPIGSSGESGRSILAVICGVLTGLSEGPIVWIADRRFLFKVDQRCTNGSPSNNCVFITERFANTKEMRTASSIPKPPDATEIRITIYYYPYRASPPLSMASFCWLPR